MSDALQIIQLANALLQTAQALGLSRKAVADRVALAAAEGRPFGQQDLEAMRAQAQDALHKLDAAIEASKRAAEAARVKLAEPGQ